MKKLNPEHLEELFEVFTLLETSQETQKFLEDMFTPQELETLAERWQLVCQLKAGTPQRKIAENLGIAIATVSRGSRQLKYGTGGFEAMWEKMSNR